MYSLFCISYRIVVNNLCFCDKIDCDYKHGLQVHSNTSNLNSDTSKGLILIFLMPTLTLSLLNQL